MIKLIATDLDGTLLHSDGTLSSANIEALQAAVRRGIRVVLCTGRPYIRVKSIVEQAGLNDEDYMITFNGGLVQKATTGEIVVQQPLTAQDMLEWYHETERLQLPLNIIDYDAIYEPLQYPEGRRSLYIDKLQGIGTTTIDYLAVEPSHLFNKMVICIDQEYLDEQIPMLNPDLVSRFSVMKSNSSLLEIMAKDVDKASALRQLGELLNIQPSEMMTIGDQENDITMIQLAGRGVAMGNATPEVKAVANYVTLNNNEDGVAHAIYQLLQEMEG